MSRRSRRWLTAGLVFLLAAMLVGAAGLAAPDLARNALGRRLAERLGGDAEIGSLQFSMGGLGIRDLRLDAGGRGTIDVERLDVRLSLLRILAGGAGSIRGARASGVTVTVPLDELAASAAPREAGNAAVGGAGRGALLRRAAGLFAQDATVRLERGRVRAERDGRLDELVRDLHAEWRRGPDGVLSGSGRGVVAGGGLEWTARVRPATDREEAVIDARASLENVPFAAFLPLLPRLPWYRPEQAPVSGRVTVAGDLGDPDGLRFAGDVVVRELGLDSPRVSEAPVVTDLSIAGRGMVSPADGRLEVAEGRLGLGPVELEASGSYRLGEDGRRMDLLVELAPTPCNQVIDAVPPAVLGDLAGFEWAGTLGGSARLQLDESAPSEARLELSVADRCRFVDWPERYDLGRFGGPFVHPIELAGEVDGELVTGPGAPSWAPLGEIEPALVWAVLAHEDAAFFRHAGFAPWAIETALRRNLAEGRFAYGASTVSMQLAKNLFLPRDKTLARKLREAILTWWLEDRLDKGRIVELYLNVIEFGPGIYGIRQAATHYFGRRPDELSLAESLFLANLLPAPARYHREAEAGAVRERTRRELEALLASMERRGWVAPSPAARRGLEDLRFHRGGSPGERARPRPPEPGAAPLPIGERPPSRSAPGRRTIDWSWLVRRPPPT